MARVFYAYTPHPDAELRELGFGERATVAVRLNEGKFEYGVAVCRADDNFSKSIGRQIALARLESGFGSTVYNEHYKTIAEFYAEESEGDNDGTERAIIQFVNDLAKSVFIKMKKYKRKLENFEIIEE